MEADEAYRVVRERAEMNPEVRERISERAQALCCLPDY